MRVVFMGTPAFAESSLQALLKARVPVVGVVSQPARPAGRGRELAQPPVARLAEEHNLPLIQPGNPHEPDALAILQAWAPDVVVVVAYGHILRPTLLQLPPRGCLNVHASLLPKYRGACPIPHAISAGESETGVTIMLLDEGTDTGPILAQRTVPIEDSDTSGSLTDRLAIVGAELLTETLPAWMAGSLAPRPQGGAAAGYCSMLCKANGQIDWKQPAQQIWRLVRAFYPWPGAYTTWQGSVLKVTASWPLDGEWIGEPGTVILVGEEPAVITGSGALILRQVQRAGKKPVSGMAFLRGQRGFVDSHLGD